MQVMEKRRAHQGIITARPERLPRGPSHVSRKKANQKTAGACRDGCEDSGARARWSGMRPNGFGIFEERQVTRRQAKGQDAE